MIKEMAEYYRRRSPIYEASMGYDQREVLRRNEPVIEYLSSRFARRTILEIACGTGFWTQFLMKAAAEIIATDVNEETLFEARKKELGSHVQLRRADAYALPTFETRFDACFAGDWFCHVPVSKRAEFLDGLHSRLARGSIVIFCDQRLREGSITEQCDDEGNNIQIRTLPDGDRYPVIKNFPSRSQLGDLLWRSTPKRRRSLISPNPGDTFLNTFWTSNHERRNSRSARRDICFNGRMKSECPYRTAPHSITQKSAFSASDYPPCA